MIAFASYIIIGNCNDFIAGAIITTLIYIYIYIYNIYILHESECDMVKYFMSRLIYFHEPEAE